MTSAEVVSVFPNRVRVAVHNISDLTASGEPVGVGSYLRIFDLNECSIMAIVESFSIELKPTKSDEDEDRQKIYMIDAVPLGLLHPDGSFERGGGKIAIPPKKVEMATREDVQTIYNGVPASTRFHFAQLAQDEKVDVPVDGNRFFNKHIAIVGSTGSGKSHTMARIVQAAVRERESGDASYSLNNSHVIIFDIHAEYRSAFPNANHLSVDSMVLPYWLLSSEELQDMFIESREEQSHNQVAVLKRSITENRKIYFEGSEAERDLIHYDSPLFFDMAEVIAAIKAKNEKMVPGARGEKSGPLNGKLDNFITRLENRYYDKRLGFLLGDKAKGATLADTLRQFMGYVEGGERNVTVIDLSGVPFEVLSISVSLISRLLFDYSYYFKRGNDKNETPLLVVYEEAHKYVPRSDLSRYAAARYAIEKIAKEGRKYGITAAIVSQRPAEISETIFAMCNNFVAMRLTNPEDQGYVRRLLPDSLGPLTDSLPSLSAGEALLIGDSVVMPSVVRICQPEPEPSSSDISYLEMWRKPWYNVSFGTVLERWQK
jgi:DNA helicase HerA-like ATPase